MADKEYGGEDRGDGRGRGDRGRRRGPRTDGRSAGNGPAGRDSGPRKSGSGRRWPDRDSGGRSGSRSSEGGRSGSRDSGGRGGTGNRDSGKRDSGKRDSGNRDSGNRDSGKRDAGVRRSDGRPFADRRDARRSGGSPFDSKRPAGRRPGRERTDQAPGGFRGRDRHDDHDQRERRLPPGLEAKPGEPSIPPGTDIRRLDRRVRAELRGLPKELAEIVAGHLLLAGELIDEDPERAYAHAEAARRRAARLPIVREGAAETAYAAGKYDVALGEFRALRRMTGSADYLPVMADCERALNRPQQALRLLREATGQPMDPASAIELRIIEAGARHDLGQTAEAARLLRVAIKDLGRRATTEALRLPAARLHYALGDVLLDLGDAAGGYRELVAASELDTEGETDAQERVDALDGLDIQFDENDDDGEDVSDDGSDDSRDHSDAAGVQEDREESERAD